MAIPEEPYEFFSIRLSKNRFSKHCKATGSSSTTRGLALATRNQFLLLTSTTDILLNDIATGTFFVGFYINKIEILLLQHCLQPQDSCSTSDVQCRPLL